VLRGGGGRRPFISRRSHGHVDVFEDVPGGDATSAIRGLDEVIAAIPLVFASEGIDEGERLSQLPGPDQKPGSVNLPFIRGCFPHSIQPWGRED
jgi:hypothetical protein